MNKAQILEELERLEGEKLQDYHPRVHELIVDWFLEHTDQLNDTET